MQTIWKFRLTIGDQVELQIPQGSKFLSVQTQAGVPCMWFLVDPNAPEETCTFLVRGTGHNADNVGDYLGTFQITEDPFGGLVFHVFTKKAN